jgi:hypothetical protein
MHVPHVTFRGAEWVSKLNDADSTTFFTNPLLPYGFSLASHLRR